MSVDKSHLFQEIHEQPDVLSRLVARETPKIQQLAAAIKQVPFDLIFCGQRAVDDDNAQVGAALSELLQIPLLSVIIKVDISEDKTKVKVTRPVEGATWVLESSLPALITTQKGLNEPRYASLPGIMKAKKKPLAAKKLADLGLSAAVVGAGGAGVRWPEVSQPPARRGACEFIDGDTPAAIAAALAAKLRAAGAIHRP